MKNYEDIKNELKRMEFYFNRYKLALYDIADLKKGASTTPKEIAEKALDPFSQYEDEDVK
tara:strand:+ start:153 stop:332 length:180 start_codon:yes stop_codon:yes gene_type:complete